MALGNPAPLGLLAFGMTTLMLMYVETGWVSKDFEALVYGYAVFYGGICQMLVAIFELIKGSSFSFAVFGSYGAFWLGWAIVFVERNRYTSELGDFSYREGLTLYFIQWGILTSCFWVVTWRKNICLIVVFALLALTFFTLAAANDQESERTRKAAGYFGFFTAIGAFYTGVAELINEEWGRHILPGLQPLLSPERFHVTKESVVKLITYDKASNTLLLFFRGLHIGSHEAVAAIQHGVESAILAAKAPDNKVHVVVDYKDVTIARDLEATYWDMVQKLERQYYLSVRRFYVSSFGTKSGPTTNGARVAALREKTSLHELEEKQESFTGQ